MKEKTKNSDKLVEDEQTGKADDMPLVALSEIYTSRETINLFVINKSKTKLKNIESNEIKLLEDEVCLIDVLTGVQSSEIDEKMVDDLRQYFKLSKMIGFNPHQAYDFDNKRGKSKLYKISIFENIQKVSKTSSDYIEF